MSLAERLFPALTLGSRSRLVLGDPRRRPFEKIPAPDRRELRVEARLDEPRPRVGDPVVAGQRLGRTGRAPVCSPVSGRVVEVRAAPFLRGGRPGFSVVVEPDPEAPVPDKLPALGEEASRRDLLSRLDTLCVASAGREAAPLTDRIGGDRGPATVLVLAADAEPLLSAQAQLLADNVKQVGAALELLGRAAGTSEVLLGVLRPQKPLAMGTNAPFILLGDEYPESLPELAARRAVKRGARPPVAVITLEEALAAHRAIARGEATFQRYLTVVGADESRRNVVVELGTPVRQVLDHLGVRVEAGDRVVFGGPMLGFSEYRLEAGIAGTASALTVVPASASEAPANDPCVSCGTCIEVCPMQLQPQLLGRNAEFGFHGRNRDLDVDRCILCGLCAYVCPGGRPIAQWIELTQDELERQAQELAEPDGSADQEERAA